MAWFRDERSKVKDTGSISSFLHIRTAIHRHSLVGITGRLRLRGCLMRASLTFARWRKWSSAWYRTLWVSSTCCTRAWLFVLLPVRWREGNTWLNTQVWRTWSTRSTYLWDGQQGAADCCNWSDLEVCHQSGKRSSFPATQNGRPSGGTVESAWRGPHLNYVILVLLFINYCIVSVFFLFSASCE